MGPALTQCLPVISCAASSKAMGKVARSAGAGCGYHPVGCAYVKTTPSTRPAVAAPTESKPVAVSIMPAGKRAPLAETPNVPPRLTPVGSVDDKSNVIPLPATKNGNEPTLHEAGGGGGNTGAGEGDGLPGGVVSSETSVESPPRQPAARLDAPNRPKMSALRRDI
jgi:hypothetical protein